MCRGGGGGWGSGPQTKKHLLQRPFTGHFFRMTPGCIAFYESYLSTIKTIYTEILAQLRIGICVILYFNCLSQDNRRRNADARCFTKDECVVILKSQLSGRLSREFANYVRLNCSIVYLKGPKHEIFESRFFT